MAAEKPRGVRADRHHELIDDDRVDEVPHHQRIRSRAWMHFHVALCDLRGRQTLGVAIVPSKGDGAATLVAPSPGPVVVRGDIRPWRRQSMSLRCCCRIASSRGCPGETASRAPMCSRASGRQGSAPRSARIAARCRPRCDVTGGSMQPWSSPTVRPTPRTWAHACRLSCCLLTVVVAAAYEAPQSTRRMSFGAGTRVRVRPRAARACRTGVAGG